MNGYPLDLMVREMDQEATQLARRAVLVEARKNRSLRDAWFKAKANLYSSDEAYLNHFISMNEGRGLLDEVLDKEIGLGCERSVHSWYDEYNPNYDIDVPF